MANTTPFPFTAHGNGSLMHYEHLKEEHDLPVVNAAGMTASSSTVVQMHADPPPRDHLVWSIFTTMYCNFCCLGLMALTFSVKARDRKVLGDQGGARSYGSTAKCLNILALVLTFSLLTAFIILLVTGIIQTKSALGNN
uniref:Uncharacterized protein n=1 Tax=Salvator merianae TaxID=96440 RepID=A0A8D0CBP8_SALMN